MKQFVAATMLSMSLTQPTVDTRKYKVYGQGNQSCGAWEERNRLERDTHLFTWVVGFVSGAAYASPKTLRETDSEGIAAWMDSYCQAHPLDSIANAAGALVVALESRR